MEAGSIKPINQVSVHKICSGQVVLTLATAVKELVENSIDAGATIIEIKLKEYGSGSIEVIDNGAGVKPSDFQSITLKHHTSKINNFSDVESVSTFGFRGEALSSLCALSDVQIITCHSESPVGSLLIYDHNGTLTKKTPIHRQVGTTVIVKNLFFTLPVRHKEFCHNIRREYAKMIQLLVAYCLISTNKKITCTNTTEKGKKIIALATNSCDTFQDNISTIFGSKQVHNLMKFVQHSPSDSVSEEYFLPKSMLEKCKIFKLEGFISSSVHGVGRSSTDRQFFFINGRPCDLPKISKLINEIYHSFNKVQYPFVFLNINLIEGSADVNVTPDKRLIFIPEETLLLCIIKTSLLQMYHKEPSRIKIASSSQFFLKKHKCNEVKEEICIGDSQGSESIEDASISLSKVVQNKILQISSQRKAFISSTKIGENEIMDTNSQEEASILSPEAVKNEIIFFTSQKIKKLSNHVTSTNIALTLPLQEEKLIRNEPSSKLNNLKNILKKAYRGNDFSANSNTFYKSGKLKTISGDNIVNSFTKCSPKNTSYEVNGCVETLTSVVTLCRSPEDDSVSIAAYSNSKVKPQEEFVLDERQLRKRKIKMINANIGEIKKSLEMKRKISSVERLTFRKFRSKIAPTDNSSAENELKKEIKKENFSEMDIIGQFNLGFIITRLNGDLFIIDQHATDEKYNFEMLQKETVLETQKLLNPQNLNLTAVSEAVLLDNMHIFEKSGFKFNINEDNFVGNKIQLVSVPVSYNWKFGKEDVDEMIFMLTDNPISMVRPSRINQMFASRACRKSVMIGTAVTVPMMKKLVGHMGEIEQPWVKKYRKHHI